MWAERTTGGAPPAHLPRPRQPAPVEDVVSPAPWLAWLPWAVLVVSLLALLGVAARGIAEGGEPVGDSALVAIRAHDVLEGELPLVGAPATALGVDGAHHPSPLLYDVLALPVALFPGHTGLVVGVALLDAAALFAVCVVARRRGGPLLAVMAALEAVAVCWALGSDTLLQPSPATVVVLPFLAFVVLAWGVACGDVGLLPWAVAAGSFVIGTNLSYLVLVPALLGFALVAAYLARRERLVWLPLRTALASVVVLALAWAQPVYEQFFDGSSGGNLAKLGRSVGQLDSMSTLDVPSALGVVGKIVALPPWWLRPAYGEAFSSDPFRDGLPPWPLATIALLGLAVELAVLVRNRHQVGDRGARAILVTALVGMAASLVTAGLTPLVPTSLDDTANTARLAWLWPVGAFGALAGAGAWLRYMLDRMPRWRSLVIGGSAVATLGFGCLAVLDAPPMRSGLDPTETTEVTRRLRRELARADLRGPLLVDCQEPVADPYCEAVMLSLQRLDVGFVVPRHDPHGLGEARRWDRNSPASLRLVVAVGAAASRTRPDAVLVTQVEGRTERHHVALFVQPI